MGTGIDHETFQEADYVRFQQRLQQCLATLGRLLERPGFGWVRSPWVPSWSCFWSTVRPGRCR